ncbi:hypothetical protein CRENBAI_006059 [Crenichthys baileyi]|uniref:Uncharacterized protein n=1 Tax=Crenichthys baileyi TaxID=28760 RepID=A0AAV9SCZ1_9TELE
MPGIDEEACDAGGSGRGVTDTEDGPGREAAGAGEDAGQPRRRFTGGLAVFLRHLPEEVNGGGGCKGEPRAGMKGKDGHEKNPGEYSFVEEQVEEGKGLTRGLAGNH